MKLTELFEQIEDRRVDRCKKHNLVDILMICFIGFLTGHKSIENIQFHAVLNEKFLRKYLKLENGIPSPDTILRVLAMIDTKQLEKVFCQYAREVFGDKLKTDDVLAVDGKSIKGSADGEKSAIHVVSAWASSVGVCFGQVKTAEKSNEITAIPELLELMEIRGLVVTIDAAGCQKKIVQKIIEKKANYVISLKGNQGQLHNDVKELFSGEMTDDFCRKYRISYWTSGVEKSHGRLEKRECWLCTNLDWLCGRSEWAGLKGVGMVRSTVTKKGVTTTEKRCFITSLDDVKRAGSALRSHWGIENSLHWRLDMTFDEDRTRNRKENSPQNLNVLRKITMNLLSCEDFAGLTRKKKLTFGNKQEICARYDKYLEKVLSRL